MTAFIKPGVYSHIYTHYVLLIERTRVMLTAKDTISMYRINRHVFTGIGVCLHHVTRVKASLLSVKTARC